MTSVDYVRYSVEMCPTARPSGFPAPGTGRKFIIQHSGLDDVYRAGGKRQCVRVIACVSGPWRYLAASQGPQRSADAAWCDFWVGSGLLPPDSSSRYLLVAGLGSINAINLSANPGIIKVRVLGYRIRYRMDGGRGEKIPKLLSLELVGQRNLRSGEPKRRGN